MAGRVRRPADKKQLLDAISESNPFETYRDALVFAAALGFARQRREPFSDYDEPIRWELFREVGGDRLAAMMAAVTIDDVKAVAPERADERIAMFEEYANGGLAELQETLKRYPDKRYSDMVLDLVLGEEDAQGRPHDLDLGSIADEFAS